jgi:hypothetical protein
VCSGYGYTDQSKTHLGPQLFDRDQSRGQIHALEYGTVVRGKIGEVRQSDVYGRRSANAMNQSADEA